MVYAKPRWQGMTLPNSLIKRNRLIEMRSALRDVSLEQIGGAH